MIEIMLGTSIMVIVLVALLGSFFGQSTLNQNARHMMAAMNDATRVMEEIRRQNAATLAGSLCNTAGIPSARPPRLTSGTCPPGTAQSSDPAQCESWNAWLDASSGKSLQGTRDDIYEIVVVTCQDQDGGLLVTDYCASDLNAPPGFRPQMGRLEWYPWAGPDPNAAWTNGHLPTQLNVPSDFNPIRVTVTVGWAQKRQGRGTFGVGASSPEFTYRTALSGKGAVGNVAGGQQLLVGPDIDNDGMIESPAMLTTMVTCR